jgi:glycerol kinase
MTPKLKHIIDNNEKIKEAMKNGRVVAATLDTWLLFRLKNFQQSVEKFELITDISNAASTSYYDPFELKYNKDLLKLFKINKIIRPKVVDNSYDFGYTHKSLFGEAIKIATIISDQSASLIGNACFRKMDAKVSNFQFFFRNYMLRRFKFLLCFLSISDYYWHFISIQYKHGK